MKVFELIQILEQYDPNREIKSMTFYEEDGICSSEPVVTSVKDSQAFFDERGVLKSGDLVITSRLDLEVYTDWYSDWIKKYSIDYEKGESIERPAR